ncbi:MAG: helix-turn-helix domain-containing protein [Kiloniellales bacterium]|nr:helix-turn-helix domain-containing protein [Kiloniellales bacterium]
MARRGRPRGRRGPQGPNPIDVHVGQRVRLRRTMLGMSQERLAEAIGLTFQQIQKYEKGANRIGSSRLFDLSRILSVPVGYFFEEISSDVAANSPARQLGGWSDREQAEFDHDRDPVLKRETLELVRAYYQIQDEVLRKRLFEITKILSAGSRRSKGPNAEGDAPRVGRPPKVKSKVV